MRPYRIFISHAWSYSDDYYRMVQLLDKAPYFKNQYLNYSVPQHDPLDTASILRKKLKDQINPVQVVIILAGIYTLHSDWIQYEIEVARKLKKPMFWVKPFGAKRMPTSIQFEEDTSVNWNTDSIISKIKDLSL
jgi:hypothetical protein